MYKECLPHQIRVLEQRFPELPKMAAVAGAIAMAANMARERFVRRHELLGSYNEQDPGTETVQTLDSAS